MNLLIGVGFILISIYLARFDKVPLKVINLTNRAILILVLLTSGIFICYNYYLLR